MAKSSRWSRLAKLGGLTTRVTSSYLGQRVREVFQDKEVAEELKERLHLDNAERVVATLGRLKGAAMKVGQQVAMAASHLDLPEDVQRILGRLHAEAEPVPFEDIRRTVERELEGPLDAHFASFSEAPLGTASLAQAHAAILPDGREVVVKVLHDGIDTSVGTDLAALRALLVSGRALGRDRAEIDAVFDEVRARLEEELDYLQEAANLQAFHEAFGDDPTVRIPALHPSMCTERVLVLDRLPGVPLDRFLETASTEARQRAGHNLATFFFRMAFDKRMLHADPHPGNYLFEADGTVGVLDFGCVKRFDPFWIGTYARAVRGALDGDRQTVITACRDLGALRGNNPKADDVAWRFCDTVVAPWREGEYTVGGDEDAILERVEPLVREMWRYREITGPPDIVYLHRTLGGLYTLARKLQVRAAWGDILREHMDHAIAVMEGRA